MNFLESLDMYGIAFTFNTFKREKFKTVMGGILTIITIIVLLVIFPLFGQELFFRLNPKIISNTNIPDDYNKVYLSNQNLTVPWRLEDINAQFYNSSNFLYPKISLMSYEFKNGSWSFKEHKFELTKCSEIEIDETLKNIINPNEWYCLNFNKIKLEDMIDMMIGGFWDGNFINFIQFDVLSCNDYKNCTSYEELKLKMVSESKIYFTMFYPSHYFSPDKKGDPFKKYYSIYSRALDPNLIKSDRILLKEAKVQDDQGWIFSDIQNYKTLTFDRDFSNYDFKSIEDYKNEEVSSRIYTFYLYLIKKEELYYRSYTKIQDLAAQTGGVLKIVVFFFAFICEYHHHILRNKIFVSEFFDSYEENSNIQENIRIVNNQNRNESRNNIHNNLNVTSTNVNLNNDNLINLNLNKYKDKFPNKSFRVINHNSSDIININSPVVINQIINKFKTFKRKNKKKNLLEQEGSILLWKNLLCKRCIKKNKINLVKGYNIEQQYINEKLDVKFYLKLVDNHIKLKSIFFNSEQALTFNHLKKINIMSEVDELKNSLEFEEDENNEDKNLNMKIAKMLYYFMKKYNYTTSNESCYVHEKDNKLHEMLDRIYNEFIEENYLNYKK